MSPGPSEDVPNVWTHLPERHGLSMAAIGGAQ
jgi:hypothetical protein